MPSVTGLLALLAACVGALTSPKGRDLRATAGVVPSDLVAPGPDLELQTIARRGSCKAVEDWPPVALGNSEDTRFCSNLGFEELSRYRHAFPLADQRFFMPVFSSIPLSVRSERVTHAVIWMHGETMNANKHFCDAMHLMQEGVVDVEAGTHVLTIVPWFSDEQVTSGQWGHERAGSQNSVSMCWGDNFARMMGTPDGGDTITPSISHSSFDVLDSLVRSLQADEENFPSLERIVITGFSSGCQTLQRWALFSRVLLPGLNRAPVTAVLGSCGSYLYLDGSRPGDTCLSSRHTAANHRCHKFHVPAADVCNTYDTYKYGLTLEARSSGGYLRKFTEDLAMKDEALDEFMDKDVRFLFGRHDTCSCNVAHYHNQRYGGFRNRGCFPDIGVSCGPNTYGGSSRGYGCCDTWPDGYSNNLAHNCEAMLQGTNRLQRGLNFVSYLREFFANRNKTYTATFFVFSGAHNGSSAHTSATFRDWVFGGGSQHRNRP